MVVADLLPLAHKMPPNATWVHSPCGIWWRCINHLPSPTKAVQWATRHSHHPTPDLYLLAHTNCGGAGRVQHLGTNIYWQPASSQLKCFLLQVIAKPALKYYVNLILNPNSFDVVELNAAHTMTRQTALSCSFCAHLQDAHCLGSLQGTSWQRHCAYEMQYALQSLSIGFSRPCSRTWQINHVFDLPGTWASFSNITIQQLLSMCIQSAVLGVADRQPCKLRPQSDSVVFSWQDGRQPPFYAVKPQPSFTLPGMPLHNASCREPWSVVRAVLRFFYNTFLSKWLSGLL